MKKDGKEKKNYSGQEVSNEPSERLINPPDKNRQKKLVRKGKDKTTAKDPNPGSRNPILR